MDGPGTYDLTYEILPPSSNGFIRHVDKEIGCPNGGSRSPCIGPLPIPARKRAN